MTAVFGTEEYAANLALGHLGQPEIASMNDTTTRARKIRQFFPIARDAMLRHRPWNFATAWDVPSVDPQPSLGPLKRRYPMPDDCLRVRFIKGDNRREWAIESAAAGGPGGADVEVMLLVTNVEAPTVCYTRRVTAVRLWDAMFINAFGYMLASYCATSLGKSQTWAADMRKEAESSGSEAASIDAKERNSDSNCRPETSWVAARRGRGPGLRRW